MRRGGAQVRTRSLVALGDLLLDVVVRPAAPIERGSDVPGEVRFRQGGSAANVARSFVKLGGRGVLICSVGRDGWGERLVGALRGDGVRVRAVPARGATGRLVALVDGGGERSFVTERGAADALRPTDVRESWLRGSASSTCRRTPCSMSPSAAQRVARPSWRTRPGPCVSVDLASAGPLRVFGVARARDAITSLAPDILFANRDEAALLTAGRAGAGGGLGGGSAGLLELAPLVVVKEGGDGCRIMWLDAGSGERHRLDIATTPMAAVDTTGAGDAFAAGFLYSLLGASVSSLGGWDAVTLRRAALAGHRSAADLLRRPRVDLGL